MKKLFSLFIALFLTLCLFGCTGAPGEQPSAAPSAASEATQSESPAASPETKTRGLTDMAGRTVTLPASVNKAYGTDPVGTITLYTLAPEKLIGWNYALNNQEKAYLMDEYKELPVYGMKDDFNAEAVIAAAPDVIIQMGATNEKAVQQANDLSERLNIPVVVISGKMSDIPAAYELLGQITGDEARAAELAAYSKTALDRAAAITIPEGEQVSVYYGNGVDSMETAPKGSDAAEVIEMAGGLNVADLQVEDPNERMTVSKEQLLSWNPDYIFVNGEPKKDVSGAGAADSILTDPDFETLTAVTNTHVYGIPKSPFAWLDRPKGPNRVVGLVWAGALMYPDLYTDVDVNAEIKSFYDLFYHMQLTDEQYGKLLLS